MSRNFPDLIEAYLQFVAGKTESPKRLHRWSIIVAIGGALTRRVWIDEVTFRLYPNKYVIFVAPPGSVRKTTTMDLALNLLKELDHIRIGAQISTWPAFVQDLAENQREVYIPDPADPNGAENFMMAAVTLPLGEWGNFLKTEDADQIDGLVDLWDCRPILDKRTKTNGSDVVEHPFVNMIACTTPHWLRQNFTYKLVGGGFSSRIIFIYQDQRERHIARPSKLWNAGAFGQGRGQLIEDLKRIADLAGPYEFDPAADALAVQWYAAEAARLDGLNGNGLSDEPWLLDFLARKQVHVHKLAMIIAASRRDQLVISEADLRDAIREIDAVELELGKIFKPAPVASTLSTTEQAVLAELHAEIARAGEISQEWALNRLARYMDRRTAAQTVEHAVAQRVFIREIRPGGRSFLQKP